MTDVNEPTTTTSAEQPVERGFKIGDKFYPFAESFKIVDPVLVREISGLVWDAFIAAATGDREWLAANGEPDEALVLAGLLACAVWRVHPDWSRAAVIRYVQSIDEADLDVVGVDDAPEAPAPGEAEPLATAATTTTGLSSESDEESTPPPASS